MHRREQSKQVGTPTLSLDCFFQQRTAGKVPENFFAALGRRLSFPTKHGILILPVKSSFSSTVVRSFTGPLMRHFSVPQQMHSGGSQDATTMCVFNRKPRMAILRMTISSYRCFHAEGLLLRQLVEPLLSEPGGLLTTMHDWARQQVPLLRARAIEALQQIASQPTLTSDDEEPLAELGESWKALLREKRTLNRFVQQATTGPISVQDELYTYCSPGISRPLVPKPQQMSSPKKRMKYYHKYE